MLVSKNLKDIQYENGGIVKVMNEDKALWEKKSEITLNMVLECPTEDSYWFEISFGEQEYRLGRNSQYTELSKSVKLDASKTDVGMLKISGIVETYYYRFCEVYLKINEESRRGDSGAFKNSYGEREVDFQFDFSDYNEIKKAGDVIEVRIKVV